MKFLRTLVLMLASVFLVNAFADENHQDNNDCRRKPTLDEQKYCLAIVHKDGTGCESIKSYELRMHCMHQIAEFTTLNMHAYTPKKKDENTDHTAGDKKE